MNIDMFGNKVFANGKMIFELRSRFFVFLTDYNKEFDFFHAISICFAKYIRTLRVIYIDVLADIYNCMADYL